MTSIDKIRHPNLAQAVKEREQAIIDRIFSSEDKALYAAFDPAKEMLFTGEIDFTRTTPMGMLGRIMDNFIDGINSFHGFITDYLQSDEYDAASPLPQADSFHYCFKKGIDVYHHISMVDHPDYQAVKEIILKVLRDDYFGYVDQIWIPLAVERLPDYARREYDLYQEKKAQFPN